MKDLNKFIKIKSILCDYKSFEKIDVKQESILLKHMDFIKQEMYDNLDNYEKQLLLKLFKEQFLASHKDEKVLCIYREIFDKYKDRLRIIDIIKHYGFFINRNIIEYDKDIIQIVVYVGTVTDKDTLVLLKRKKGEERLNGTIDFVAGHVCDIGTFDIVKCIKESVIKEVKEELGIDVLLSAVHDDAEPIGEIYPSNNKFSVSYYHLGLIYKTNILNEFKNNEPDRHDIIYSDSLTKDDLKNFSSWLYKAADYFDL